ncbi:response regulator [Pseudalkalibacillus salsuginis]|uniref:response regulator n=1 Tax=Pseudalkalibacillus salsuginis TaxID=2910972 RepID=UPI001F383420|nr:response regulator [Pseudalkalibacillus salsuginis]MCF6409937.1 response regulator [Pseudalkalibacillus salsuginis]
MNKYPAIKVLLIEDDPMVREVNRQFIERVEGFQVIASSSNGKEGLELARSLKPELIILDIYMPEKDGLELMAELRALQLGIDVLVITAANDKETIRTMLLNGAIDYIIKPFKFTRIQKALEKYKALHTAFSKEGKIGQEDLDRLIKTTDDIPVYSSKDEGYLPKGLNQQTLKQILRYLSNQETSLSAEETADGVGIARVTARRYLDYLGKTGKVELDVQYGGVGRPINRYRLVGKVGYEQ